MKNFLSVCAVLFVFVICIPLLSFAGGTTPGGSSGDSGGTGRTPTAKNTSDTIPVFITAAGKVQNVPVKDYLLGVIGAEMPANYQTQALKAQAVASYTYVQYCKMKQEEKADKALKGAWLSDDSTKYQAYLDTEALKAKWKDNYDQYAEKINNAIDEVLGETILYQGKPILAAFFSVSSGKTNPAKDYWGSEIPYLTSVDSNGDKLSPSLTSTVSFSEDELKGKLKLTEGVSLEGKAETWIGKPVTTDTGLVTEITVGGKKMSGRELREALGLKSAQFTVSYKAEKGFTFTVKGYGHNVGMSQYGADYMARQGADYKEILEHYYTGVTIEKLTK